MGVAVQYFADTKFYQGRGGYFRSSLSRLMHREVYGATYGNIPHGWQVHHKDGNPANNVLENLACHPTAIHQRVPKKQRVLDVLSLSCASCGRQYETPDKGGRHKFCCGRCKQRHYRRLRGVKHTPSRECSL